MGIEVSPPVFGVIEVAARGPPSANIMNGRDACPCCRYGDVMVVGFLPLHEALALDHHRRPQVAVAAGCAIDRPPAAEPGPCVRSAHRSDEPFALGEADRVGDVAGIPVSG